MGDRRLFRGPNGVIFSPAEAVHEDTVAQRVESGDWTPVEEKKPEPAPRRAARSSSKK